ncbi:MAG: hypothetical protein JWR51_43 [Devosia sp.]|uniref:hypothetical protein n=1 Tax=Devosia sp. TaxID=1871048 RepID=UPI00261F5578|nr:hypothetical protein [Devosia sp.]MDB5526940.1 hypothetical protein [Devosia sp.]
MAEGPDAVLGTSPLMIILADHLARSRPVTIFEERPVVGGAWSQLAVGNRRISSKTNILVPLGLDEEPVMARINALLLDRFGIEAIPSPDQIRMLSSYSPQNRFHYDLQPLFASLVDMDRLVTMHVSHVIADMGSVEVGGHRFARMYLPYFAGVEGIAVDGKLLPTPFSEVVSEHLLLILDGEIADGALYCEDFNEVFDRVQIKNRPGEIIFTGRVARAHKGRALEWLTAQAVGLFPGASVLHATIDKYRNFHRNEEQLATLQAAVDAAPQLYLVNTGQFVAGFKSLLPLLQDEVVHG